MKKNILITMILLLPYAANANEVDLKTMLNSAMDYHPAIKSYAYKSMAKEEELEAQKRAYFPTVDLGANYQKNDPVSIVTPGQTQSAYVIAGLDIYDGGKKSALVSSKKWDYQASVFEKDAFSKNVVLDIINRYFTIQKLQANLVVLNMKSKELSYQIERANGFVSAGLATTDDVDKLQAAFDDNNFTIDSTTLALKEQEESLKTQSGIAFDTLAEANLQDPSGDLSYEPYDKTKLLEAKANSVQDSARSVLSAHIPQVSIQNTYTVLKYDDMAPGSGDFLLDNKNTLMITANWRIFDGGQILRQKEAIELQSLALKEEQLGSQRDQESAYRLAKERLDTMKSQIKSTTSALKATQSTYEIVTKKFEAGLADNVAYLDALNEHSATMSRYKSALYDYEIAKSLYYYFAGKNPKEYIK
ncbi:MAG: TolC family protein [Sulfurovaceae bacterium]|nr:TolC family protein [Sulfurovaceae bacterium]